MALSISHLVKVLFPRQERAEAPMTLEEEAVKKRLLKLMYNEKFTCIAMETIQDRGVIFLPPQNNPYTIHNFKLFKRINSTFVSQSSRPISDQHQDEFYEVLTKVRVFSGWTR